MPKVELRAGTGSLSKGIFIWYAKALQIKMHLNNAIKFSVILSTDAMHSIHNRYRKKF